MRARDYIRCVDLDYINLKGLYNKDYTSLKNLDNVILKVIEVEAPVTMNVLKARLREAMNIKKISQNVLDLVNERLDYYGIVRTNNLYDEVLWGKEVKKVEYLRLGHKLPIYDVAYQELAILIKQFELDGIEGEWLYRRVLEFYGFETLTKKAREYLDFVISKVREGI